MRDGRTYMTPNEYRVLQAAANYQTVEWFEHPERLQTTNDLVRWGYIAKVDLHAPDTGAEPRHYRTTDRGRTLLQRAGTWKVAKPIVLPES
jgi:hypothetical protein